MLKKNKNNSDSMHICIRAQHLNLQNIYFMDFAAYSLVSVHVIFSCKLVHVFQSSDFSRLKCLV